MKILKIENFLNEKLQKTESGNNQQWQTQIIGMINYDVNLFNQDSIILEPNKQKQYFQDIQKKFIDLATAGLQKCEGYENNIVMASKNVGNAMNIIKILTDFNLYKADEDGKVTKELCDTLTKESEKMKGITGVSFSIVSFGKDESQQEVPAGYNQDKHEWEQVGKLQIKDREMK